MGELSSPAVQFDHFYAYDEIDTFVRGLAEAFPDLCRLSSIGQSREGKDIHLLTLADLTAANPDELPAYVIHGGIHAHEPASTHGPLFTAQKLLENHERAGLLSRMAFHILPRLCPDSSELSIATSTRIRSRTDFTNRAVNTIYPEDLDGDGLILTIRQEHPDGEFVVDRVDSRLLVGRCAESPGPYYRLFPEGLIHDWDRGERIRCGGLDSFFPKTPEMHGGRSFDWNRNWSYNWRPEGEQVASGDFPFSEPEMRHLALFLHGHPKIFGILGYHCGRASIIRPPASGSRQDLDAGDDAVMEELGQKGAELTGSPLVTLIDSHDGRPNKGKGGHSLDTIYNHLGIFGFEVELGTILNAAGLWTEDNLPRSDEQTAEWMRRLLKWWDDRGQSDPLFESWRSFDHPQLGPVELGGFQKTALDNPLVLELHETVKNAYAFTLEHARRRPQIVLEDLHVDQFDKSIYRIRVRVANRGQLPTHVTNKGRSLRRLQPVRASLAPVAGVELLSEAGHLELGHLEGVTGSRIAEWFVAVRDESGGVAALGELYVAGGTGGDIRRTVELP